MKRPEWVCVSHLLQGGLDHIVGPGAQSSRKSGARSDERHASTPATQEICGGKKRHLGSPSSLRGRKKGRGCRSRPDSDSLQRTASASSLRMPRPVAHMSPRPYCASAVVLLGGQPVPAHRFGLVLENAPPGVVPEPEVELGERRGPDPQPAGTSAPLRPSSLRTPHPLAYMTPRPYCADGLALLGSQPVPAHRFGVVLENAPPVGVHDPEAVLRNGLTLLSVNEEPSQRCGIVATAIRCHSFVKCLPRRDWRAGQRSQQRQGDNAAPNQPVFNACL